MYLSDLCNMPFILDKDPSGFNNDFSQIKPNIFNLNRKLVYQGKEYKVNDQNIIDPFIKTTKAPTITGPTSVNENESLTFTIIYESGSDFNVWCDKGKISSIDKTNGTFVYVAPDITNSTNIADTIYANATKVGELQSDITIFTVTVVYVPMVADDVLSNTDFQTNEYTRKGVIYE